MWSYRFVGLVVVVCCFLLLLLVGCAPERETLVPATRRAAAATPIPAATAAATGTIAAATVTPAPIAMPSSTKEAGGEPVDIARRLAEQGQRVYEYEPLPGLRLALEGLSLAAPEDEATKTAIMPTIQEMAGRGRLLFLDGLENVKPSPDGTRFLIQRPLAGELRRAGDGQVIASLMELGWAEFSATGAYFLANHHPEGLVDLRRSSDGEVIATFTEYEHYFSPDDTYLVVNYFDHMESLPRRPGIVYRIVDGVTVELTDSFFERVTFSPDSSYFIVDYVDLPGELRYTADDRIVTLGGEVNSLVISPDSAYFVVVYANGSSELRRASDGQVVEALSGTVWGVFPSPDGQTFVVSYSDAPGELRRAGDGQVIATLADEAVLVSFSPDGGYFLSGYYSDSGTPSELRRASDGQVVTTLTQPVNVDIFSSPFSLDGTFVAVDYNGAPGEWRHSSNGQLVATLAGDIGRPLFSPDGAYVALPYDGSPGELRRTGDGQVVATFACESCQLFFSRAGGYLLVLDDMTSASELWAIKDGARRLAQFEWGYVFAFLGSQEERLVVGSYLLDLDWLDAMGGDPAALAPEELVRILCQGPMASGMVDESDLAPYLEGRRPQACR